MDASALIEKQAIFRFLEKTVCKDPDAYNDDSEVFIEFSQFKPSNVIAVVDEK